jgi:hypothetical protein
MSFQSVIENLLSDELHAAGNSPTRLDEIRQVLATALILSIMRSARDKSTRLTVATNTCEGIVKVVENRG